MTPSDVLRDKVTVAFEFLNKTVEIYWETIPR